MHAKTDTNRNGTGDDGKVRQIKPGGRDRQQNGKANPGIAKDRRHRMLQTLIKFGVGQNACAEHALEETHHCQHDDKHQGRQHDRTQREMNTANLNTDKRLLDCQNKVCPGNIGKDHDRNRHGDGEHHHIDQDPHPEIKCAMHRIADIAVFAAFGAHQIGMHKRPAIGTQQPVTGQECQRHHQVFKDETRQCDIANRHQNRHQDRDYFKAPARSAFDL